MTRETSKAVLMETGVTAGPDWSILDRRRKQHWEDWGALGTSSAWGAQRTSGPWGAWRTPHPWVPRGLVALTVVAPVAGLLLAAVGRHAVDLHPHEGVHDGAALLLVQLGQLLGRDDLRARGCRGLVARRGRWPRGKGQGWHMAGSGDRVGVPQEMGSTWVGIGMGAVSPRGRDVGGSQRDARTAPVSPEERWVAPGWAWGWCHPAGLQVAPTLAGGGDAHPDVQHEAVGALDVGAAQEGGLQHVATAPIAQEAPGVQVHLVARCLEVEGHCGDRDEGGDRGITLGAGPGAPVWGCPGVLGAHPAGSRRSTSPGGCSWRSSSSAPAGRRG